MFFSFMRCLMLSLLLAVLLHPVVVIAEIYSWRDENGTIHFTDRKIEGVGQSTITLDIKKPDWEKFRINITDIGAGITANERKRIEEDVKTIYRFFDNKLYFDIYKTIPVNVTVFGQRAKYERYIKPKTSSRNTRGMYFPQNNEIVVYIQKNREGTFRTIKHETSHAIIDTLTPFVPAWLNEGIAENMEILSTHEALFYLDPHVENYNSLIRYGQEGKLLNISEFISMKSPDWRNRNRASNYVLQVQAGEFVRLLMSSSSGQSFLTRLIHSYKRGDRRLASNVAKDHYIGGLFALENNWESWRRRRDDNRVRL